MNAHDDSLLRARLAFNGNIVASATHEFQNHFAVIKEYNGLIGDLLRAGKPGMGSTIKRCLEISVSINDRADRAAALMDILNRFSHRSDTILTAFRVDEVVMDLVALMQRTALQKCIELVGSRSQGVPLITNNPSLLQYLLWLLLTSLLDTLAENSRVTVSVSGNKDGAASVQIKTRGPVTESDGAITMSAALAELGASISRESGRGDRAEIRLIVPSLSAAASR